MVDAGLVLRVPALLRARSPRRPRASEPGSRLPWLVCILALLGCRDAAAPPSGAVEVLVADVEQRDVPVTSEWVGTTDGYINAQIRAKVQGYLLIKAYRDG